MKRENFLYYYAILVCCLTLGVVTVHPSTHYKVFVEASYEFFNLINPYGKGFFGGPIYQTHWVYSPTAALLFYPLHFLPQYLGSFVYMFISALLFFLGVRRLEKPPLSGFFYLIVASELIGSIQANKFELITTAFIFWFWSWMQDRKYGLALVMLAFVSSLKFQTLPLMGLVIPFLFREKIGLKYFALLLGSFLIFVFWPVLFFPFSFLSECYFTWTHSMSEALRTTWGSYQSLYCFFARTIGFPNSYAQISLLGTFFAGIYFIISWNKSLPFIISLAVFYTCLFSPLSQSSGFILSAPLLFYSFQKSPKNIYSIFIFSFYWITTSLLYSDVAPAFLKTLAWDFNLKPLGVGVITLWIIGLHNSLQKAPSIPLQPRPA